MLIAISHTATAMSIKLESHLSQSSHLLKFRLIATYCRKYSNAINRRISLLPSVTFSKFLSAYSKFTPAVTDSANEVITLRNSVKNKLSSPPWLPIVLQQYMNKKEQKRSMCSASTCKLTVHATGVQTARGKK